MHFSKIIKIISLSIALLITTTGISMSADTLQDSLKKGKVNGEAKIWYQTNDSDTNKHFLDSENSWFDAGIRLTYITDAYKGFKAGVTFYAVDDLSAYENLANRSMMGVPHDETWTWLGEAYLTYKCNNTSAKVGRQNITSPLINSDAWPIFPNNFEAIMVQNTDIADTTLNIGYVGDERWRGTEDFEESTGYGDEVLMLGAINKSIQDVTLTAYVYDADLMDTFAAYVEAKTNVGMFGLASQYLHFNPDESGASSTDAFGAKVSTKLGKFDTFIAYTYVTDGYWEAAKLSDNHVKTPLYTATYGGDGDVAGRPDTESIGICASTKLMEDFNLTGKFVYYSCDDSGKYRLRGTARADELHISDGDATSTELLCMYSGIEHISIFAGAWYTVHEGIGAYNGKDDGDLITFRTWAKYEF